MLLTSVTLTGDGTGNAFLIQRNGPHVQFYIGTSLDQTVAYADLESITVNGLAGDDTLTVDLSAGNPIASGGLSFDGGEDNYALHLVGSSSAESITANADQLTFDSVTVTYTATETLNIDTGAGNDSLIITALPAASTTFNAGSGADSLQVIGGGDDASASYLPNASNPANAALWFNGRLIALNGVEDTVAVSGFLTFTYTTPAGADTLTLNNSAGESRISGTSGGQSLPNVLFSDVRLFTLDAATSETTAAHDVLTVDNPALDPADLSHSFEFRGGGGSDNLNLTAGALRLDADASDGTTDLNLAVSGASTLLLNNSQHFGSLSLAGASTATLAAGGPEVIVTRSLDITADSTLDLADNAMIVDYAGSSPGDNSPIATIRQYLINGRGGSGLGPETWAGTGGISSSAAATRDPTGLALGYREAQPPDFGLDPVTSFAGQTVDDTAILIRFTYTGNGNIGDANLDGVVDRDDLNILSNSFGQTEGVDWVHGDFDYNGTCDRDDLNLQSGNFGNNPGIIFSAASSAIEGQAFYLTLGDSAGSVTSTLVDWGDGIQYPLGAIGASTTLEHEFIGAPALYTISVTTDNPAQTRYKHVFVRPAAPTDLTFIVRSTGEIDLNWGNDPSASYYTIYEALSSPVPIDDAHRAVVQDHSSYVDVNVSEATTYYYTLTASHEDGTETVLAANRAASTLATDQALKPRPGSSDAAPSHLRVESINDSEVLLTWQDNSLNEQYFEIQQWDGTVWITRSFQPAYGADKKELGLVEPNDVTYTVWGLPPSTPSSPGYAFRVRATNKSGATAWTDEIWGDTRPLPSPRHMIIIIGGHFQDQRWLEAAHTGPVNPFGNGNWGNGVGALWRWLWRHGYNAYLFEEYEGWVHHNTLIGYQADGPAWSSMIRPRVDDGDGAHVTVIGYSHGGGIAYRLVGNLLGAGATVDYCALIDAVVRVQEDNDLADANPLTLRPAAGWVDNLYETRGWAGVKGGFIFGANLNVDTTSWMPDQGTGKRIDHRNIDKQRTVLLGIFERIHDNIWWWF